MIRVLLVENNPADAKRALDLLRDSEDGQMKVTHVERLSSALHRLGHESFDAILMDRTLVDTHGLDTLDLIQAALGRMPIVVLGEKGDGCIGYRRAFFAVKDVAGRRAFAAIAGLRKVIHTSKSDRLRVSAINMLLDLGYGRPPQASDIADRDPPPFPEIRDDMTLEELQAVYQQLRRMPAHFR